MGFTKPAPVPGKTCAHGCGYGFPWVRVRIALENPRVAHDIPYEPLSLLSSPSALLSLFGIVIGANHGGGGGCG